MNTVFDKARDLATALLESEAGKKVNDARFKVLDQMGAELNKNQVVADMVRAEDEFNKFVGQVMNVFNATLSGDSENSNGGCTGSCSTCGGCH